jgi:DNA-directed RNA polymerase specialized sigma24 family protein
MPIPKAGGQNYSVMTRGIVRKGNRIRMSRIDAEEATRDVFLAVMRKADRLREDSWNHSWINRICMNTCRIALSPPRRRIDGPAGFSRRAVALSSPG